MLALQGLREVTAEDGALLCFDEVMTGFRIAKGCAQEHFGVTPDLTTVRPEEPACWRQSLHAVLVFTCVLMPPAMRMRHLCWQIFVRAGQCPSSF